MAYCTADEVKRYLDMKVTDTSKDELIEFLVSAAESFINEYCGKSFDKVSTVTEYFSECAKTILLTRFPIDSKKTFTVWDSWDRKYANDDIISPDDYFVDYEKGIVKFDYEVGGFPGAVKIVYSGGGAGGGSMNIPTAIKQACIELAARKLKEGPSGGLLVSARSSGTGGSVSYVIEDILPQTKIALDLFRV